eukprot:1157526-Pelagomonas_calceolata.AAC.5
MKASVRHPFTHLKCVSSPQGFCPEAESDEGQHVGQQQVHSLHFFSIAIARCCSPTFQRLLAVFDEPPRNLAWPGKSSNLAAFKDGHQSPQTMLMQQENMLQ